MMHTAISKDHTHIAYERSGSGPPLLLVHGTSASRGRWARVLPQLQRRFTVFAMDRRGRGDSGDTAPWAIEREFDDVAAVARSIRDPLFLLGHSFGAICALEAARLLTNVSKLALYEPPVPADVPDGPGGRDDGTLQRLEAALSAGDREAVLTIFFREVNGMPQTQFDQFRQMPEWQARLAAAHTLPREIRAVHAYRFHETRFQKIDVPTLLLLGGDSPAYFGAAVALIQSALADARTAVLPGQRHVAMDTAPDLFVDEVVSFFGA